MAKLISEQQKAAKHAEVRKEHSPQREQLVHVPRDGNMFGTFEKASVVGM